MSKEVADSLNAKTATLDEKSTHWWMLDNPKEGAKVLVDFWKSV
jgi:hypothetical protein